MHEHIYTNVSRGTCRLAGAIAATLMAEEQIGRNKHGTTSSASNPLSVEDRPWGQHSNSLRIVGYVARELPSGMYSVCLLRSRCMPASTSGVGNRQLHKNERDRERGID